MCNIVLPTPSALLRMRWINIRNALVTSLGIFLFQVSRGLYESNNYTNCHLFREWENCFLCKIQWDWKIANCRQEKKHVVEYTILGATVFCGFFCFFFPEHFTRGVVPNFMRVRIIVVFSWVFACLVRFRTTRRPKHTTLGVDEENKSGKNNRHEKRLEYQTERKKNEILEIILQVLQSIWRK